MGQYEKLDAYKFKFDNALSLLQATKCDLPSTDDIITKFIESLNSDYDELKLKIKNDDYAGIPNAWPATLDLAYIRAAKFVTSATLTIQQNTGEQKQVAFLGTVSELSQKKLYLKNNNEKNRYNPTTPRGPAANSNTLATEPTPNATASTPTLANANNPTSHQGNTSQGNSNQSNPSGSDKQPKRPCHICGEMHWTSQCPHLALCQSVVASNNHGTDDANMFTGLIQATDASNVYTGITEASNLFTGITLSHPKFQFSQTDIILDNASEPNIFKSKDLL